MDVRRKTKSVSHTRSSAPELYLQPACARGVLAPPPLRLQIIQKARAPRRGEQTLVTNSCGQCREGTTLKAKTLASSTPRNQKTGEKSHPPPERLKLQPLRSSRTKYLTTKKQIQKNLRRACAGQKLSETTIVKDFERYDRKKS